MTTKLKVTLPFSTLNTTHSTYMYSKHAFFNIFGPIMSVLIDTLLETVFYLFILRSLINQKESKIKLNYIIHTEKSLLHISLV